MKTKRSRKVLFQGLVVIVFGVAMLQVKCSGHNPNEKWASTTTGRTYSGSEVNEQETSEAHYVGAFAILGGVIAIFAYRRSK